MSRNHPKWEREPDSWYVEPAWPSERLFAVEPFEGRVVDPCAGMGTIVRSAAAAGLRAEGFDLRDRGFDYVRGGKDFFSADWLHGTWPCENIVSNPPYATWAQLGRAAPYPGAAPRSDDEFVLLALSRVMSKVAVFLPSGWINGAKRGAWLESMPLYRVYLIGPRPSCPPGQIRAAGQATGNGETDYSWFVFLKGFSGHPTVHFLRREG